MSTQPDLWVLKVRGWEVARVKCRSDGLWMSDVNRHLRDWKRRHHLLTPSRSFAIRCAERYTKAHLARILTELPEMRPGPCGNRIWYPLTNPNPHAELAAKPPSIQPRVDAELVAGFRRLLARQVRATSGQRVPFGGRE